MSSSPDGPTRVIATYRVVKEKEEQFTELLRKHWPTLREVGLVKDEPPVVYRNVDEEGRPTIFEIFDWKDAKAPDVAHHTPAVMQIWEAMGTLVEERDGRPMFEFPHVETLSLDLG